MPDRFLPSDAEQFQKLTPDIVQAIREPMLLLDRSHNVLWANDSFFRSFRMRPREVLGTCLFDLRGGGWNDPRLKTVIRDDLPLQMAINDFEFEQEFPDIGRRSLLLNLRELNGSAAGEPMVLLTVLDATERRKVDAQQSRLAALVESSDDAIIAQSFDGEIIDWNRGAERMYGYSMDEMVGQSFSIIVPPDRQNDFDRLRDMMRAGKHIRNFETVCVRKDGSSFPVSLTFSPIRSADGRIVLVSSIARDMTRRMRIERELREAKEQAERASRVQSEFMANMSHELRTPMNAIIGMTDIALDCELSHEVRDALQTVRTSADVLMELLNDVLDFSKLKSGNFEIDRTQFALRETIDSTIKAIGLKAYEKGLEVICDVESDVPDMLIGDPLRLRQILTNLLSNAVKFTESGEIEVNVSCSRRSGENVTLLFRLRDTGIGISEEDQSRIFAPFTQADSSLTRSYPGTGLGLSICQQLVRQMQGQISVKSEESVGSEFAVSLPFKLASRTQTPAFGQPDELRRLEGMPVLIVDDNSTNRRQLAKALANWSMQPETVSDGQEALSTLREAADRNASYPLVILDALMPDLDGFSVAERISEDPRLAESTVLMLSSADRQVFRERCSRLSVSAYLEKPVSQSDLWDTIVTSLGGLPVKQTIPDQREIQKKTNRKLHILVVEDMPANQKVVQRILEKRGHAVQVAFNGRVAIDLLEEADNDFDLVLMDVQMPTLDGYQATAAIRAMEDADFRDIPIIAMTAHAMAGDRDKCLAAGMDGYLSKPIDARRLITLVESFAFRDVAGDRSDPDMAAWNPSGSTAELDIESALTRLGGDRDLLKDMLEFLQQDIPPLLEEIHTSFNQCDAERMERAAHSLKGLSSNFDANEVVKLAAEVERLGRQGDLSAAAAVIPRLERRSRRLLRDAQAAHDTLPDPS